MSLLKELLASPPMSVNMPAFRKSHTIAGSSGGAQTDYPIKIKVHRTIGTDSGIDVYLGPECRSDFGDIRFTEDDGLTELDYWIEQTKDLWASKAVIPQAAADVTACNINDKLYFFGGYDGNTVYDEVYEYDPATNNWTEFDSMPTARWGHIAIAYGGKAYVFGGVKTQPQAIGQFTAVLEIFDPSQSTGNQWTTGTSMSYGAQGIMGVFFPYDAKIHLFGGYDLVDRHTDHITYDPETDTYSTLTDMPTGRNWGTGAVVGNNIFVIGGYTGSPTDVNERYNPATDDWTTMTAIPVALYGATRENPVMDDKIYVTHGRQGGYFTTVHEYNVAEDSWDTKTSGSNARDGVACAVIGNMLYVVGGRANTVGLDYHEAYDPKIPEFWVEVPAIPADPSTVDIYIYYGKADATTTEDGEATFSFFDHFTGVVLDTSKWTEYYSLGSGGVLTVADSLVKIHAVTDVGDRLAIESDVTFTPPYSVRARAKFSTVGNYVFLMLDDANVNPYLTLGQRAAIASVKDDTDYAVEANGVDYDRDDIGTAATFKIYEILRDGSGNNDFYVDEVLKDNDHAYPTTDATVIVAAVHATTTDIEVDWVLIRKYVDPEPTHGAWGSEEQTVWPF